VRLRALGLVLAVVVLAAAGPARAASVFYIRGAGYGHGIGMSQYGAYGYALHGMDYRWILAHYYQGTAIGQTNPQRIVRVLLSTGPASFSGATRAGTVALDPAATYTVRPGAGGTVLLAGTANKIVDNLRGPISVSGPGPISLAGLGGYRGALEFRPDGAGGIETINAIDLEDYVRGVISAEMPASWSPDALEAQAVAARTYVITTAAAGPFDVYSDTRSQMYRGVAAETSATDAAVAATRGQVVTYNGVPVVTYFSASSGGHTENIEDVWPGATPEPWLRGVPDPYDSAGGNPYYRWGRALTLTSASAQLGGLVSGTLRGIAILTHGTSPRILTASVVGTRGRTTVTGQQLQQAFGLLTTDVSFTTITTVAGHTSLSGTVFPASAGATVSVQAASAGPWRTIAHATLAANGVYQVPLPASGTYRIAYAGINGPAVVLR
jgi:stage II sporulation protein D